MKRVWMWLALGLLAATLAWAQEATPPPDATPAPEAKPAEPPPAEQLAKKLQLISPMDNLPVDGWKVETIVTRGVDTDFCYLNASDSYYQKLIATDPRSGYTGYPEDFYPALKSPLSPDVVEKVKKKLPKLFPPPARMEPWDRYEIVAQIYIWRKMPEKEIGNAYLRATYTMRGLALGADERQREHDLRDKAIDYLREAETKAQFSLAESPQVKYLIGDLYRRNGEFKKAIRFFEDAGKLKNRPDWLDEMIVRQRARAYAYDDR
jgi:tetratricopeptide (TPR) repeat protein